MTDEPMDAARVWAEMEDRLFPALGLDGQARALYYHLLRVSRLEGRRVVRLSRRRLARTTGLSEFLILDRMRVLEAGGCIRVVSRGPRGTHTEVLLPEEVPQAARPGGERPGDYRSPAARAAIFAREGGRCFYCLRQLTPETAVLDHVVAARDGGSHTAANLVAACSECNLAKSAGAAEDHLRALYRTGRLTARELDLRLAALTELATRPGVGMREAS